jgi:hypothetical protein
VRCWQTKLALGAALLSAAAVAGQVDAVVPVSFSWYFGWLIVEALACAGAVMLAARGPNRDRLARAIVWFKGCEVLLIITYVFISDGPFRYAIKDRLDRWQADWLPKSIGLSIKPLIALVTLAMYVHLLRLARRALRAGRGLLIAISFAGLGAISWALLLVWVLWYGAGEFFWAYGLSEPVGGIGSAPSAHTWRAVLGTASRDAALLHPFIWLLCVQLLAPPVITATASWLAWRFWRARRGAP